MRLATACLVWCGVAVLLAATGQTAEAQNAAQNSAKATQESLSQRLRKIYGLPDGTIQSGDRKRVTIRDDRGDVVTAQIHVRIGNQYLVQMPNGRLAKVGVDEVRQTNAPFRPADRDVMKAELSKELGPGFKITETKNYIVFYTCSDAYQKKSCEVLEAVHAGIYKYFDEKFFSVHKPDVPLVAVIFKTSAEFHRFGKKGESVNGYYDQITNHIVFYEESDLAIAGEEAARDQMLGTVAHEGVHQTLCNIGVQPRLVVWPLWVMEGLAEFFAPTIDGKTTEWKGVGQVNDTRMAGLEPFFKAPAKNRGYLKAVAAADQLDGQGYAFAWGMVHYLSKEKPASLMQYLRSLNSRTPLEPPVGKSRAEAELEVFERYFAMTPAELEIDLAYHLRKLPFEHPWQNAKHYVAIVEYPFGAITRRAACMCLLESGAETWRNTFYDKLTADQRARATFYIKELANRDSAKEYAYRWLYPQNR